VPKTTHGADNRTRGGRLQHPLQLFAGAGFVSVESPVSCTHGGTPSHPRPDRQATPCTAPRVTLASLSLHCRKSHSCKRQPWSIAKRPKPAISVPQQQHGNDTMHLFNTASSLEQSGPGSGTQLRSKQKKKSNAPPATPHNAASAMNLAEAFRASKQHQDQCQFADYDTTAVYEIVGTRCICHQGCGRPSLVVERRFMAGRQVRSLNRPVLRPPTQRIRTASARSWAAPLTACACNIDHHASAQLREARLQLQERIARANAA